MLVWIAPKHMDNHLKVPFYHYTRASESLKNEDKKSRLTEKVEHKAVGSSLEGDLAFLVFDHVKVDCFHVCLLDLFVTPGNRQSKQPEGCHTNNQRHMCW